jgi:hypothetical protein
MAIITEAILGLKSDIALRGCFKSLDCDPNRPLNPPILEDFEAELAQKSPKIGGLGGECKAL